MANDRFERLEFKYLITRQQQKKLLEVFPGEIKIDSYGRTDIFNLYLDTDDFRLIRNSIEKPVYKEKLRVRSYGKAAGRDQVFIELKKKYKGVVYKRRIATTQDEALDSLLARKIDCSSQIGQEIEYFTKYYRSLKPRMFIGYERVAYFDPNNPDFRVTFDENIRYRLNNLTLDCKNEGALLIDSDHVLMEIKIMGSFPLWLAQALSMLEISKSSFSKYGNAYKECLEKGQIEIKTNINYNGQGVVSYA
ncbi:MAG: polyphosphate polymerase domain-containing protein [Erysipelotrichaceae bacterium]|nr:polyphosphate polymerase domain-containing protein [Erysipelotrichaceae bacterium]